MLHFNVSLLNYVVAYYASNITLSCNYLKDVCKKILHNNVSLIKFTCKKSSSRSSHIL